MTQGARILVVDDEPQIRRSLQVNLESKAMQSKPRRRARRRSARFTIVILSHHP